MNKLLFIDDEINMLKMYKSIFNNKPTISTHDKMAPHFYNQKQTPKKRKNHFLSYTADQGSKGIEIFQEHLKMNDPFKIVFIDMRMPPGINGKETARKIRLLDHSVQIVFVTAQTELELDTIRNDLGSCEKFLLLKKPFDIKEITQLTLDLTLKSKKQESASQLVKNLFNDLKTPIATISGSKQLLRRNLQIEDQQTKDYLKIIEENAYFIKDLVKDLKSKKKQPSESKYNKSKTDIVELIHSSYKTLSHYFTDNQEINFKCSIPEYIGEIEMHLNKKSIQRCIQKLILNAKKYTEAGSITLGLDLNNGFIEVFVRDTGCGIIQEKIPVIISKSSKYKINEENNIQPSLYYIKEIAKMHYGKLNIESKIGHGSQFSILFPFRS